MYYLEMKTAIKPYVKSKTFCSSKNSTSIEKQEKSFVDFKFYQKLFILLISLSTILIFPESPVEMENICEFYNSKKLCNVM